MLLVDDVPSRITFPPCTGVDTGERPDVIVYSPSKKIILWAELTVPLEENVNGAQKRKTKKYCESDYKRNRISIKDQCERNGWTVHPFTVEVGSIGFVAKSFDHFLFAVGFQNPQRKATLASVSKIAMRSSFLIWNCRFEKSWDPPALVPQPSSRTVSSAREPSDAQDTRDEARAFLDSIQDSVRAPTNPSS